MGSESGKERRAQEFPPSLGRPRSGRPAKATWQFLYECGTERELHRSESPSFSPPPLRPLARSERLLAQAHTQRQPLTSARVQTAPGPTPPRSQSPRMGTARTSRRTGSCGEDVGSRLYEQCQLLRQWQDKVRKEATERRLEEQMRECTFKPQTKAAELATARHPPTCGLSLYYRGVEQQARRKALEEEASFRKEQEELAACTFRPQVGRGFGRSCRVATPQAAPQLQMCAAKASAAAAVVGASASVDMDVQLAEAVACQALAVEQQSCVTTAATECLLDLQDANPVSARDHQEARVLAILTEWRAERALGWPRAQPSEPLASVG